MLRYVSILLMGLGSMSCTKDVEIPRDYDALPSVVEPIGFEAIPYPSDNIFTTDRWALGKKLFYDKRLAVDSTLSCASCHQQDKGWADDLPLTPGIKDRPAMRNAPTLTNVAYHPYYTREGGVPTLEMQVLIPISEHNELGFNMVRLVDRLSKDSIYQSMAQKAYNRSLDAYVITRALANFERSLISGNSRADQFNKGKQSLNEEEIAGRNLFYSTRTNCSQCHSGFNFTNYAFENNGLYTQYKDPGRYRLTLNPADSALFKVPTLRMVGLTAPYMHDGSIATLEQVIDHYNSGGKNHPHKSILIRPLGLDNEEKRALVSFLKALSDEEFLDNRYFMP
ncbi:MAG: cytochrome c peroxidase [Saprospiraceae bacterium]